MKRISPQWITYLSDNQIFVFGSNKAGRHGAGAAKQALLYGAKYGTGIGLMGQTYAIPTKGFNLEVLSLSEIKTYVDVFIQFAELNPHLEFLVTKIGCGLAGYTPDQISPLFKSCLYLQNVYLPIDFVQ